MTIKILGATIGVALLIGGILWIETPGVVLNQTRDSQGAVEQEVRELPTGMQLFRSAEFGFEFWYPETWDMKENTFRSPYSKLNLKVLHLGDKPATLHTFLVNVVTQDFAENAAQNKKELGAQESVMRIDQVSAKKYEYVFQGLPMVSVDIPFGEYRILVAAEQKHEKEFNAILESFRFFPPTTTR